MHANYSLALFGSDGDAQRRANPLEPMFMQRSRRSSDAERPRDEPAPAANPAPEAPPPASPPPEQPSRPPRWEASSRGMTIDEREREILFAPVEVGRESDVREAAPAGLYEPVPMSRPAPRPAPPRPAPTAAPDRPSRPEPAPADPAAGEGWVIRDAPAPNEPDAGPEAAPESPRSASGLTEALPFLSEERAPAAAPDRAGGGEAERVPAPEAAESPEAAALRLRAAESMIDRASAALAQGRLEEAQERYEYALNNLPGTREAEDARERARTGLARAAHRRAVAMQTRDGSPREILDLLNLAALNDPDFIDAIELRDQYREIVATREAGSDPEAAAELVGLGRRLLAEGKLEEAEAAFRRALERDPNNTEAASLLFQTDDTRPAGPAGIPAEAAVESIEDQPLLRADRGATGADGAASEPARIRETLYEAYRDVNEGNPETAIPKFEWVIERDPTQLRAWESLGWAYWNVGRQDDTLKLWKRLELLAPDSPLVNNLLSKVYVARNELDQATIHLDRSLEIKPDQYDTRYARARVQVWRGRSHEAVNAFRELLAMDPDRLDVRFSLTRALMADREYAAAVRHWQIIRNIDPDNLTYLLGEAQTLLRIGDLPGAKIRAREAMERAPDQLEPYYILADAEEYGPHPERAIPALWDLIEKARDLRARGELEPGQETTVKRNLLRLVELQMRLHEKDPKEFPLDAIVDIVVEAIDDDPRDVNLHLLKGELQLGTQEYAEAIRSFERVLEEFNPNNRRAYNGLFQAHMAQNHFQKAEEYLEKVEAFDPRDPYRHYNRARFYISQGKFYDAYDALDLLEREGDRGAVLGLLYHGLTSSDFMPTLSVRRFREQLLALRNAGFRFIPANEIPSYFESLNDETPTSPPLLARLLGAAEPAAAKPNKPNLVATVTFDDALRSSFRWGTPVADEMDLTFAMHVAVGNLLAYDPQIASWEELRRYQETGHWIMGSHLIDASTYTSSDAEDGYPARPLPNRIWNEREGRQETQLEYLLRVKREIAESQDLMNENLGLDPDAVTWLAYPMGDIGQEDRSNVDTAIQHILNEASLVYDFGFRQSIYGYTVKGANPLLYQRYELDRWDGAESALAHAFRNHPVYMAKHMRAEVAALHGRPHMARRMIAELKAMDYPDVLLEEVDEYVQTRLTGRMAAPEAATGVEEERAALLRFRDPYLGGDFEFIQDDEQTETWMWRVRGGVNLTPQLTLEGHYGQGALNRPCATRSRSSSPRNGGGPERITGETRPS
jgi:tetratricopeptide (TPR) repeat protein